MLLSILFVAVQFATRHSKGEKVPDETLIYAMANVDTAALLLLMASQGAMLVFISIHGFQPAWIMFSPLLLALVLITNAIRLAAQNLKDSLESDDGDTLNTKDSLPDDTEVSEE